MTRRNIELVLLCIAAPIVILMFAMISINEGIELNLQTLGVPIGIFASFIVAHFAVRKFANGADPAILPISFTLSGIGIAFVTRLRPELAVNQLLWLFLGVGLMVLVLVFIKNADKIANYKYTLMIFGVLLLLSPMIPGLGEEIYGSRIWLYIAGYSFQPGEIAKVLIVLFLAGYLAVNREMLSVFTVRIGPFNLPDLRTLLPLILMWALALIIVVFEKDLGSALVFFFVFLAMLYAATGKKFYLVVGLALAGIGALAAWSLFSHVQVRVDTWLDPFADAQNTGYQLVQTIYSMADGGLFGVGIDRGYAEIIPVVESDFIFAAIAEETGLLGAAGLLLLYLCLAIRGLVTAARAKSDVSSFIAVGATAIIVLQAFIIVGGVTRLIPLTGLTLPFVSQGGSSLIASFISVGLILKCGDEGTGVEKEMKSTTLSLHSNSVLGRISLGKRLTNLMFIFSIMFALLVANLTLIMVVQADEYKNMPGNNHTLARKAESERGTISTYDGVVLARSVQTANGTYEREYPAGNLGTHIVGYYSQQYGTSGIEASYDEALTGDTNFASWTDVFNSLSGKNAPGNDVTLTLNSTIQQACQDSLNGYSGAAIAIDPNTGAILGMASSPTYNASDYGSVLATGGSGELVNRATQSLYAPGSTFKILTLAAAIENDIASETTVYSSPGEMEIGNGKVTSVDNVGYGSITLSTATEVSSNTVFGQLGVEIGADLLVSSSEKFGFNDDVDFDLPLSTSLMPRANEMTEWETAWSAIGQPVGQHESPAGPQVTALQMALIGCSVANEGEIKTPYVVESISNADGATSYTASPSTYSRPISSSTANRVKTVLEGAVTNGTGYAAMVPGIAVAGKTGTAEVGRETDDSWFVGMAPAGDPSIVVVVVLEEGALENSNAAAKAQNVLKTALQVQGYL